MLYRSPQILFLIFFCMYHSYIFANKCIKTDLSSESIKSGNGNGNKKWAIVALIKPSRAKVNRRNELIAEMLKKFGTNRNVTIIFFSEEKFEESKVKSWQKQFAGFPVRTVDTSSRGFNPPHQRYGYKYMCKFFTLDMYEYLEPYDYYMRVDTDCHIVKLDYNVFDWAEKNEVQYGWGTRKLEPHGPTKSTLPVWTQKYIENCGLYPSAPMDQDLSTCFNFYNNFHIGDINFFRRADVKHFLTSVNASGFIQSHRWGDSTIQAYAVRLFMNPSAIRYLPDFEYIHGSHGNRLVSTFGKGEKSDVPQRLPLWKTS